MSESGKNGRRTMRYYRRRGFETERILVRALREVGVWAYRIPASGMYESRRQMSLPDVIAHLNGRIAGFQLKATSKKVYRVSALELVPLRAFILDARDFGINAVGYIAVRFVGARDSKWVVRRFEPNEIEAVQVKGKQRWRWVSGEKVELSAGHGYSVKVIAHRLARGEI